MLDIRKEEFKSFLLMAKIDIKQPITGEDETFRLLCKSDFATVYAAVAERTENINQVLADHGWSLREFEQTNDQRIYNYIRNLTANTEIDIK